MLRKHIICYIAYTEINFLAHDVIWYRITDVKRRWNENKYIPIHSSLYKPGLYFSKQFVQLGWMPIINEAQRKSGTGETIS